MNNDISTDLKFVKTDKQRKAVSSSQTNSEILCHDHKQLLSGDFKGSMAFLGSLGCAQVNMDKNSPDKNTAKSVAEFIANPDYAEMHTELCDNLVSRGYALEDAINITDEIFSALSNRNIYKE